MATNIVETAIARVEQNICRLCNKYLLLSLFSCMGTLFMLFIALSIFLAIGSVNAVVTDPNCSRMLSGSELRAVFEPPVYGRFNYHGLDRLSVEHIEELLKKSNGSSEIGLIQIFQADGTVTETFVNFFRYHAGIEPLEFFYKMTYTAAQIVRDDPSRRNPIVYLRSFHNHPSGIGELSSQDIGFTSMVAAWGRSIKYFREDAIVESVVVPNGYGLSQSTSYWFRVSESRWVNPIAQQTTDSWQTEINEIDGIPCPEVSNRIVQQTKRLLTKAFPFLKRELKEGFQYKHLANKFKLELGLFPRDQLPVALKILSQEFQNAGLASSLKIKTLRQSLSNLTVENMRPKFGGVTWLGTYLRPLAVVKIEMNGEVLLYDPASEKLALGHIYIDPLTNYPVIGKPGLPAIIIGYALTVEVESPKAITPAMLEAYQR